MFKFEDNRVKRIDLQTSKFKFPIPIICIRPKTLNDKSCIFIFNSGIGGTNNNSLYLNNPFYDSHYFVSYEKQGHGDNKNKPSQYKKPYLNELDQVVDWAKKEFPNKCIYLLGESWGTTINLVYYKKHVGKVSGAIGWNAPLKIVDAEKKTFKQLYSYAWRELLTLLLNIKFQLPSVQTSQEKFSQNRLFCRAMCLVPESKSNSKITLSVWRYMRPCRNILFKDSKKGNLNFLYIQSKQDALCHWPTIEKIQKKSDNKHFYLMPTGFHVLSLEPIESNYLYNIIREFVEK